MKRRVDGGNLFGSWFALGEMGGNAVMTYSFRNGNFCGKLGMFCLSFRK
jgi:hypothetical protein